MDSSESSSDEDAEHMARLASVLVSGTENVIERKCESANSSIAKIYEKVIPEKVDIRLPDSLPFDLVDLVKRVVGHVHAPTKRVISRKKSSARKMKNDDNKNSDDPDFKKHCQRQLDQFLQSSIAFADLNSDRVSDTASVKDDVSLGFEFLKGSGIDLKELNYVSNEVQVQQRPVSSNISKKELKQMLASAVIDVDLLLSKSSTYVTPGNVRDYNTVSTAVRSRKQWKPPRTPRIISKLVISETTDAKDQSRKQRLENTAFLENTKILYTDLMLKDINSLPELCVPCYRKRPKEKKKKDVAVRLSP